jgi:tol-pal system protein YbgF
VGPIDIQAELFFMRRILAVILVTFTTHVPFAMAQDAGRIDQLEEQIRQLTGQVEELTFTVKQLQTQGGLAKKTATLVEPAPAQPKAVATAEPLPQLASGIEVIEEQPLAPVAAMPKLVQQAQDSIYGEDPAPAVAPAPGPTKLGAMANAAAQANDGGFQGQVVEDPNNQLAISDGTSADGQVQQVSLVEDTPEALYKRSDEALLRRKFSDAETGFKKFLAAYPDHSLAGSAQYWLGETYYAQGDYRTAAQSYLVGYQKYAKSRRAPDSLVKLGIALNKLGQKDQACSFLGSVQGQYPSAVEANKRAQVESKRAGC